MGDLSNLTVLNLSNNQLSGHIPAGLGNLSELTVLNLYNNQLSGSIPVELASLSNLTRLYLGSNQLTGSIPVELASLSNLTHLYLGSNRLTGSVPMGLASLSNLTDLYLNANNLSGSIPAGLGNLSNLTVLNLSNNQLSGSIPAALGNLSELTVLHLRNNQLSSSIPVELASLSNLTHLYLGGNSLTGCVPASLWDRNFTGGTDILSLGLDECPSSPAGGEAQTGAPPTSNIRVANGHNPGEVIISWDAVPEVTHYRIGYVNMETDYPLAKASKTGNWQAAFVYVDVEAENFTVVDGRTEYTIRRLEPGVRHAFTVRTSDGSQREPTWPVNPRWTFHVVADHGGACPAATPPNG